MRIGLVCPYNYYRPGGVQSIIRELAAELTSRGHYVKVIAPKPKVIPDKEDGVILIGGSTEFNTPFATKADIGASGSNDKLDKMLADEKFDVLHFHEPAVPVISMQLLGRSTSANVATLHAKLPEDVLSKSYLKLIKPAAKFIAARTHAYTAVSSVAENAARMYVPDAEITIVPNGIKLKDYQTKTAVTMSTKKTILYVGRLEKRKGVKHLLMAYELLSRDHKDVELVIAGKGDLRPGLETIIKKNKIPNVSFTGFIPDDQKIKLLHEADIYCSPALYGESFGIVLLEAMAAGTVTVAGNNPGYASLMVGRGRLSLVSPESTEDFAQRLELMLYDQQIRALWLEWSNKHVKQFDYSLVTDQYEAVYKQAIKVHKSSK